MTQCGLKLEPYTFPTHYHLRACRVYLLNICNLEHGQPLLLPWRLTTQPGFVHKDHQSWSFLNYSFYLVYPIDSNFFYKNFDSFKYIEFFNRNFTIYCILMGISKLSGSEGTLGCLLHQSPKFYYNFFFFVGLTILGTLIEFWLIGSLSWVSKRFNHKLSSTEGLILCILIGDVHQFIVYCLIPLQLHPC